MYYKKQSLSVIYYIYKFRSCHRTQDEVLRVNGVECSADCGAVYNALRAGRPWADLTIRRRRRQTGPCSAGHFQYIISALL